MVRIVCIASWCSVTSPQRGEGTVWSPYPRHHDQKEGDVPRVQYAGEEHVDTLHAHTSPALHLESKQSDIIRDPHRIRKRYAVVFHFRK
jgi:hypothetical protein